jgi:hypothetical protein
MKRKRAARRLHARSPPGAHDHFCGEALQCLLTPQAWGWALAACHWARHCKGRSDLPTVPCSRHPSSDVSEAPSLSQLCTCLTTRPDVYPARDSTAPHSFFAACGKGNFSTRLFTQASNRESAALRKVAIDRHRSVVVNVLVAL